MKKILTVFGLFAFFICMTAIHHHWTLHTDIQTGKNDVVADNPIFQKVLPPGVICTVILIPRDLRNCRKRCRFSWMAYRWNGPTAGRWKHLFLLRHICIRKTDPKFPWAEGNS